MALPGRPLAVRGDGSTDQRWSIPSPGTLIMKAQHCRKRCLECVRTAAGFVQHLGSGANGSSGGKALPGPCFTCSAWVAFPSPRPWSCRQTGWQRRAVPPAPAPARPWMRPPQCARGRGRAASRGRTAARAGSSQGRADRGGGKMLARWQEHKGFSAGAEKHARQSWQADPSRRGGSYALLVAPWP